MRTIRIRTISRGFAALGVLAAMLAAPEAVAAQTNAIDARDLLTRIQRMERDLRDLQAETFRRPPGSSAAAPQAQAGGNPDLGPIMRRLDEFADGITRLTGQFEELSHQVELLNQKSERMQKDLDYQAQQTAQGRSGAPAGDSGTDTSASSETSVASLAPPQGSATPGVLGRLPADAVPVAPAPRDARSEYDAAMGLLSRAQYAPASEAFRAFIDAHPEDERTPTALYWTGDIAFSALKNYDDAARNFAEVLKRFPQSSRAPESMLKLGLSLVELGQSKEGCAALAALPAKYPSAGPAIAARARAEMRDRKCR